MMDAGAVQLSSGDRLILSTGGARRVLLVSAVNNQVVKYFDETGQYEQMPLAHLAELAKNHQLKRERNE